MLRSKTETTGHDLLAQHQAAAEAYLAELARLQNAAEDRRQVIDSRLNDLEAEKLVLNRLTDVRTVDLPGA
jgi:hypothetical protein